MPERYRCACVLHHTVTVACAAMLVITWFGLPPRNVTAARPPTQRPAQPPADPRAAPPGERAPAPTQDPNQVIDPADLPWPSRLGYRAAQVDHAFQLVDRVVLVPDVPTLFVEIMKWSPNGRWPVLLETEPDLAAMFIRRFKPAEVIRRPSANLSLPEPAVMKQEIATLLTGIWGGNPREQSPIDAMQRGGYAPPGVVIASMDDPAWVGAVVLAAGRVQPLRWLDGDFGTPGSTLLEADARDLAAKLRDLVAGLPFSYDALGDDIDAVTFCRNASGRVLWTRRGQNEAERHALTDVLGRHEDESRWACVGWVFGDEARSVYVAMSSLFLPRERIELVNTYDTSRRGFSAYTVGSAADLLNDNAYSAVPRTGPGADRQRWHALLAGGVDADIFMMNTQGMVDYFKLSDNNNGYPHDVPVLHMPAAVHFTHSWSMRAPDDPDTIAGRWLAHGAYAYVGSMQEPYLQAFLPPAELSRRMIGLVPFLVAARHWEQHPWRINTFGDPLMTAPPPNMLRHERLDPADRPADDTATRLNDHARDLLAAFRDAPDADTLIEAIETVALLGRDDLAVQCWRLAEQHDMQRAVARVALGPLFRRGDATAFMAAWTAAQPSGQRERDMLWQLMTPRLHTLAEDELMLMQAAVRTPKPQVDLERLAPHLRRTFGQAHVRTVVQRYLDEATDDADREPLRALLTE